jgi:hypothetical protein
MNYLFFALLSLCALSSADLETSHWFGSVKMNIAKEGNYKAHADQALDAAFKMETATATWLHDELVDLLI